MEPLTRREALIETSMYGLALYAVSQLGGISKALAHEPVFSYTMPDKLEAVNIEAIVKALDSNVHVIDGDYLPQFVNLIQSTHKELTGMTILEHVKKRFGFDNPIDVVLIKDLIKDTRAAGNFRHANAPWKSHKANIDADLSPPTALRVLNHELVHGYNGTGEIVPYALSHRDISYMVAKHPELLMEKDSSCPLYILMRRYIGRMVIKPGDKRPVYFIGRMDYLTLLNEDNPHKEKNFSLDSLEGLFKKERREHGHTLVLDAHYRGVFYEKVFPEDKPIIEVARGMANNFLDFTQDYIYNKNPNFPKKALLTRKINFLRNYVANEWKF